MTCAQCGSAAITEDDRPWWRDDLCAACNWRARAEAIERAVNEQNRTLRGACKRRRIVEGCSRGDVLCRVCPRRYIIELPGETGEGNG